MARAPKVYQTRLGFFDTVVAAPSQAAALRAWGVRQNLFATKDAQVTEDPQAVAAAVGRPGTPLMRPAGSQEPFSTAPSLPRAPDRTSRTERRAPHSKEEVTRKPPDRTALDTAERRLVRLSEDHAREAAELKRRREVLEEESKAAHQRWRRERKAAEADVTRERRAFERAGGARA